MLICAEKSRPRAAVWFANRDASQVRKVFVIVTISCNLLNFPGVRGLCCSAVLSVHARCYRSFPKAARATEAAAGSSCLNLLQERFEADVQAGCAPYSRTCMPFPTRDACARARRGGFLQDVPKFGLASEEPEVLTECLAVPYGENVVQTVSHSCP